MRRKRNGWRKAFFILLVLLAAFIVWLFWPMEDDFDDDYSYGGYYGEYGGSGHPGSGHPGGYSSYGSGSSSGLSSGSTNTVNNISALPEADGAVRDPLVTLKGGGEDTVTVLVYMNGSDLETDDGEATDDLSEMVAAGSSDRVNVLVETLGTKQWNNRYSISSATAQRHKLSGSGLQLVQNNVGSVNCGAAAPLTDFIRWGVKNYPADRYILLFWDHGGGPVYGFGYDDKTQSEDSLTVAEMQKALRDAGTVFDFIGMDCCIMSSIEVCCALYDFCDYMILSEDFESGEGWSYTGWLRALYENTSLPTPELGRIIVDDMVAVNARQGEDAILAVIDESYMKRLYASWVNFAYANENTLLGTNYARKKTRKAGYRVSPILEDSGFFAPADRGFFSDFFYDEYGGDDADMSEYFITDIMAVADNISGREAEALSSALNRSLVYMSSCGGSSDLTGFSVTLPYGDTEFYDELKDVFLACGFDSEYVSWLSAFSTSAHSGSFFNYDSWDNDWGGWDNYEDDYDWDDWDEWDEWDDSDWGWTGWHHPF